MILVVYLLTFAGILAASNFLNSDLDLVLELRYSKIRFPMCVVLALIVVLSVGIFEFRQMITLKLEYFRSAWNYNDWIFIISIISLAVLEYIYLYDLKDKALTHDPSHHFNEDKHGEISATDSLDAATRLLKPKPRGGSGGSNSHSIIGDDG